MKKATIIVSKTDKELKKIREFLSSQDTKFEVAEVKGAPETLVIANLDLAEKRYFRRTFKLNGERVTVLG